MSERGSASALAVGAKRRTFVHLISVVTAILVISLAPALGVTEEAVASVSAPRHDVTFANASGQTIWMSIMEYRGGSCLDTEWMVKGWWTLPAGDDMTYSTYAGTLWYYGENEGGGKYGGDVSVHLSTNPFEYCIPPQGVTWDLGDDYFLADMDRIDLTTKNFTMTLT